MPDREKAKYKKVFGGIRSYERKLNQQQVVCMIQSTLVFSQASDTFTIGISH